MMNFPESIKYMEFENGISDENMFLVDKYLLLKNWLEFMLERVKTSPNISYCSSSWKADDDEILAAENIYKLLKENIAELKNNMLMMYKSRTLLNIKRIQ